MENQCLTMLQGMVQYKGTLCGSSFFTRFLFSAPTPAAVLCEHKKVGVEEYKAEYTLVLGQESLKLDPKLSVYPQINDVAPEKGIRLSRLCNQDDTLWLRACDEKQHAEWLRAIQSAIADAAFQGAFTAPLQLNKIEKAMVDCATLVPDAHCHMRRARRLVASLKTLRRIVRSLEDNDDEEILRLHRQDIEECIAASHAEPVLRTSADVALLKELMEQRLAAAEQQAVDSDILRALRGLVSWEKIILEPIEEDFELCQREYRGAVFAPMLRLFGCL